MTQVPLPDTPCFRVKLDYTEADGSQGSSRFHLSYSGGPPTAGNCQAVATGIGTAWANQLAEVVGLNWSLTEVDVIDIASDTGASGTVAVNHAGSSGLNPMPAQVCTNVEYDIARRYRGGKPRMFLPPPGDAQRANDAHWTAGFITQVNTQLTAFFADIHALTGVGVSALSHINLSYYQGFTNVTNSSGRTRAAATYRKVALSDPVISYACKGVMGSQKRRRTSTSP